MDMVLQIGLVLSEKGRIDSPDGKIPEINIIHGVELTSQKPY